MRARLSMGGGKDTARARGDAYGAKATEKGKGMAQRKRPQLFFWYGCIKYYSTIFLVIPRARGAGHRRRWGRCLGMVCRCSGGREGATCAGWRRESKLDTGKGYAGWWGLICTRGLTVWGIESMCCERRTKQTPEKELGMKIYLDLCDADAGVFESNGLMEVTDAQSEFFAAIGLRVRVYKADAPDFPAFATVRPTYAQWRAYLGHSARG